MGSQPTRTGAVQVTVRDRAILAWAGRQRFVTPQVLALRPWARGEFGSAEMGLSSGWVDARTLRARLYRLRAAGLVMNRRFFYEGSSAWTVTAKGLREGGLQLPPASIDIRTYEHDLRLAILCAELEGQYPDYRVLTEREIKAIDTGVLDPIYGPGSLGSSGIVKKLHYPDLAVDPKTGERPLAIELELTPKSPARLRSIMDLYKRAHRLSGVRYYVDDDLTENAVRRAMVRSEVNEHREIAVVRRVERQRLA